MHGITGILEQTPPWTHFENSVITFTSHPFHIHQIVCGSDATIVLSTTGQMYACGNNEYNKLCLNRTGSILSRRRPSVKGAGAVDSSDSLNHSQGAEELGTKRGEIRVSKIFQPARATQARRPLAKVSVA